MSDSKEPDPIPFAQVLEEELKLIRKRRAFHDHGNPFGGAGGATCDGAGDVVDKKMMELRVEALKEHTTGLTFSGGGIRAGTFAIGILQGLASLGLIKRFDYLSTVSGGGYAGGWLAAWLKRQGDVANVEKQLTPNRVTQSRAARIDLTGRVVDEEPEPIRHLRAFSSYMTPKPGVLTTDTWTILMIWSRNIIINLLLIVPLAMLVILVARVILYAYRQMNMDEIVKSSGWFSIGLVLFLAGCLLLLAAFGFNTQVLSEFRRDRKNARRPFAARFPGAMKLFIIYPITLATVLITIGARGFLWSFGNLLDSLKHKSQVGTALNQVDRARPSPSSLSFWDELFNKIKKPETIPPGNSIDFVGSIRGIKDVFLNHLGLLEFPTLLLLFLGFGLLAAAGAMINGWVNKPFKWRYVGAAFVAGGVGGSMFGLLAGLIKYLASPQMDRPDLMAVFVPPLALAIIVVSLIVEVALMGREIEEAEREWWARFSAHNTVTALVWMFWMATILYVPFLLAYSNEVVKYLAITGWFGSGSFALIAGRFILPKLKSGGLSLTALAAAASTVFLVGMVGLVALLIHLVVDPSLSGDRLAAIPSVFSRYLFSVKEASRGMIAITGFACAIAVLLARSLIDVNLFSINAMYANRLIRCYLGASRRQSGWKARWYDNPRDSRVNAGAPALSGSRDPVDLNDPMVPRDANPVTGFDPKDDFDLLDLQIGLPGRQGERPYWGPHLLINTTLNLVAGDDLAWRDRKGESFLLSPLYCGSKGTGYARMTDATRSKITLGRAISISGAAIDPNMSFYQSRALTALLTVFNARLGYWVEKPKPATTDNKGKVTEWGADSPPFGDHILDEFLGKTNSKSEYVHISDGGHFENLGVYELIRRRCRYIVVIDSGEDGDAADDNMSIMIRLCRIDFGVRINIDTRPLEMFGDDKLTKAHVVIGQIHYDDVDQGEMPGVMVYIKVSLTGDEPADLLKYARKEPAFPHQATDFRQSFNEEQFECYRCLGAHVAREVFGDPIYRLRTMGLDNTIPHKDFVPTLFSAVQGRWTETTDGTNDRLMDLEQAWGDLHGEFRESPALAWLSRDIYPELPAPTAIVPVDVRDRAELHAVIQMLELMSSAWVTLNLRNFHDLPGKRGWLNTFRRWVATRTFQKYWPMVRSEFDSNFVRFCESELHLTIAEPETILLPSPLGNLPPGSFAAEAVKLLVEQFDREWPKDANNGRGLNALIQRATTLQPRLGLKSPPIWLIVQAPSGPVPASQSPDKSVVGIILAADFPDHPAPGIPPFAGTTPVEFFAWVRRPYRAVGMGSPCVRQILHREILPAIKADSAKIKPVLWVRYPKPTLGGDSDLEGGIWLNFYARFDFRKFVPPASAGWGCTLLVLE